ncbi:chitobiase/beta-hexosaminidase C-terminal domain-containing protein [Edaphobacter sp.]|uniref:chitobiase/beta-hexosaminidase C-terminal domain-containing protein n=1 Tax=Edaphobacter sp. TaxID=1934404 RepID=UPI002DB7CAEF|nr:chitobiase/beta-hexosaminidase C-terminal domain-containing protein [Edaphobacter sp.]HEU5342537.1 chitobiase/beta-hexosaminidase C-terminal domain-containing protein [Edaphobacter sp.]
MSIDSFDGPVTTNEINSFKAYINALRPASNNVGNQWAQHNSGEDVKAMALVYQITQDTAILDQMVRFCDAVLSERNDLAPAPTGQYVIWTGRIDPVWPNEVTTTPIGTGGEQGDPVGHLGNCARLILQTPSIWNTTVPIGDPDGYGTTYLARAKTYVAGGDAAIDGHILKSELDLSNSDHQYFAASDPYKGGTPVPWNQQMMFDYGFQNLAIAHDILGDDPARAAQYHQIVQDSINWFFSAGYTSYTDNAGNTAYSWGYSMPSTTKEDNDHGSLDVNGFYRAYMSGEYGITPAMLAPFGNTFVDVMTLGPGDYSGVIDGTTGSGNSASTTYIRSGWLLTADFLPSQYENMMGADFTAPGTTTAIDRFSRFLWLKNKRYQSFTFSASPSFQTVAQGSSANFIATVAAQGAFAGSVALSVSGLPSGASASFSPVTISGGGDSTMTVQTAGSTPAGTYPLTILATSMGTVAQTATVNLTVSTEPTAAAPTFNPAGGTYSSAQSVTMTSSTSGATIRYTTDGSTPSETNGTVYSGAVNISSTTTLKAIAYKSGYADSSVTSATYTITTGGTLPSGWSDTDIGGPGVAGSASYSSPTFTVSGSGADIYGTADQFNYAYMAANGNVTITARVATQQNTNSWAKAGVMIRETTAAGSTYVGVYVTPAKGVSLQYRTTTGASATNGPETTGPVAPYWVRLARSGSTFTASTSPDGTTWTQLGTATVTMATNATAGLAVSSHNNTVLNTSTFDNVSITTGGSSGLAIAATSESGDDGGGHNVATTIDGNYNTYWQSTTNGSNSAYAQYDLGSSQTVHSVKIAWYLGNTRSTWFDVDTSTDGTNWTTALSGVNSSGTSNALETYTFSSGVTARYVRYVCYGTNIDNVNAISETQIWP